MASSSRADGLNLFSDTKLESINTVQRQPAPEILKCTELPDTTNFRWKVSEISKFWRFLYLGTETGAFQAYAENVDFPNNPCDLALDQLLKNGLGMSVIGSICKLANEDVARFQKTITYALAVCACSDGDAKKSSFDLVSQICTYPTMLLQFAFYYQAINQSVKNHKGWTKGIKAAVGKWYSNKRSYDVAFAVSSCPSFNHLSHRRLIKLSHIKPSDSLSLQILSKYITQGFSKVRQEYGDQASKSDDPEVKQLMELLHAVTQIKQANSSNDLSLLIAKHGLTWGHLPHSLHNNTEMWKSTIPEIPLDILIQKLPYLQAMKVIDDGNKYSKIVIDRLTTQVSSSQMHPFRILWHKHIYAAGFNRRGGKKWIANKDILEALDTAFYKAIKNVKPTGKRICVTTDASKSMKGNLVNSHCMDCLTVISAMCLILAKTESNVSIQAFSKKLQEVNVTKDDTIATFRQKIVEVPLGGTDCARPMISAKTKKHKFDCFIIFTDKETWHGKTIPTAALWQYRQKLELPAKLIVVALTAKKFQVADASDRGMLDICGFSEHTPQIISDFIADRF
uniref:60 kDa SS-A/Ro ribonucleoprotein-like n=1 Tax=Phallusia mammillata TaxID=59560 RepID=A0A6F9DW54_9ASCI|nr:60 kDa SS-A/Ro ribonucleoprotein-like [Phallusia mammillata]